MVNREREVSEVKYGQLSLAPIEGFFIGSTTMVGGKFMTGKDFARAVDNGEEIGDEFYTPQVVFSDRTSLEAVISERENRRVMLGSMPIFSPNSQVELLNRGIALGIELPAVDKDTGRINPSWRIVLMKRDGEVPRDSREYGRVKLSGSMKKHLVLERGEDGLVLKLNR